MTSTKEKLKLEKQFKELLQKAHSAGKRNRPERDAFMTEANAVGRRLDALNK